MSFTPGQCRAARALIGWSQDQLAAASKVAKATIANFEAGTREPYTRTLADIQKALESAGVAFTNGGEPGVKLVRGPELWSRVVFRSDSARAGVTAIMQALAPAFAKAGVPSGAKIWHKTTGAGDEIYFFPPALAGLIPEELKTAGAIPAPLPNLKVGFKDVKF